MFPKSAFDFDEGGQHGSEALMKRYIGLVRDTWWLWIVMFGGGLIAGYFQPIFFTSIPIILFAFLYFGLMRYDAEGELTPFDQEEKH